MRKNLISKMLCGVFLSLTILNSASTFAADSSKFNLTATPDPKNNCINLSWNGQDGYSYMLYSEEDGLVDNYQSIPCKDTARVLNIYPGETAEGKGIGNNLKTWMAEPALELATDEDFDVEYTNPNTNNKEKYKYIKDEEKNFYTNSKGLIEPDPLDNSKPHMVGDKYVYKKDKNGKELKGLITVTEINIDDFNASANTDKDKLTSTLLKDYDVIYEGGWDKNNSKSLNNNAVDCINKLIENGKGYLAGHDTVSKSHKNEEENENYNELYKSMNIYPGMDEKYGFFKGTSVKINKKGLLTNYPWYIGTIGNNLEVPYCHNWYQFTAGDVWLSFNDNDTTKVELKTHPVNSSIKGSNNFYLTTWANTAMIQTGHSNGQATPDEEKILANTLFYLSQITTNTSWNDHKGQDIKPPTTPNIKTVKYDTTNKKCTINYDKSEDEGNTYNYYLKAFNKDEVITTKDNPTTATITTGLDKYLIVVDDKKDTNISEIIKDNLKKGKDKYDGIKTSTATNSICDNKLNSDFYVHVAAIDNAGNVSETSTYNYTMPTLTLEASPTEDTTGSVTITAKANNPQFGISKISYKGTDLKTTSIDDKTLSSTYKVTENGDYTFTATDTQGNKISKTIPIGNIHPMVLNVEPASNEYESGNDVAVNLTINNIKDISDYEIVIKYDNSKLLYSGVDTNGNFFNLKSRNTKDGEITFSLKSNVTNTNLLTNKLLILNFTSIASGKANVSVSSNSKLYGSNHLERKLLPIECGATEISISDNNK